MSATEKRDLRSGRAVWEAYPTEMQWVQPLKRSRKADVTIVGAGITGALLAEALSRAGMMPLVIDRRPPAQGSTAASTALLQFEIDKPLVTLAEQIGFDAASRAWQRSYGATQGLAHLIGELEIPCAFRIQDAIYLCGDQLGPDQLAREASLRASIGLPSRYLDRQALFAATGLVHDAAIASRDAADVNPVQLTQGLLKVAAARGAPLHSPVDLAEIAPAVSNVGLVTRDRVEIETRALVFATGYELADGIPSAGHRRTSTWAYATKPQPESLRVMANAVLWEASDPYLYMRSTIDGRLVVGGEDADIDDETARDRMLPDKVDALQEKVHALLPWLDVQADYCWAGTFGESSTGLPTIGPIPGMPNCYGVLGYGGNGITFGYLARELLTSYLLGVPDPDRDLFAFKHG